MMESVGQECGLVVFSMEIRYNNQKDIRNCKQDKEHYKRREKVSRMEEKKRKKAKAEKVRGEKKVLASIKSKLVCVILPVTAIMLAILVVFSYSISSEMIEKTSTELLQSSVSSQATSIEAWLDKNLSAFSMAKQTIEKAHPSDEQLQTILNGTAGYDSNYPEGLYVGDTAGHLWKSADSSKSAAGMLDSTWFKEGLTRVNMKYGTAYQNEAGENLISASAILNNGADPLQVVSADVSLQRITVIVNSFVQMDDAEAFLVDASDKTILASRDEELVSTKLKNDSKDHYLGQVAKRFAERNYGQCTLDGNLTVFEEIAGTDWVLVSFIPKEIIFSDVNNLRMKMIIISIIAVLILVLITERCIHIVIHPVKGLTQNITAMSDGDFTINVKAKGNDEIGRMSRSVSDFIISIRGMLNEIQQISNRVAQQSANTNEVSGNMHDVAEIQENSMKELNITVDQLSVSINEIAESATRLALVVSDTKETSIEVENCMDKTVEISEKGKQDMQQIDMAMDNISKSIYNLDQAIGKVGKASDEITDIVAVIGNIAEETNLLSLNASIEAARAGEAGKGFSVVASEIGKLAQTSAESVDNIVSLIGEITRLVQETVSQAQVSMESIDESSGLIQTALGTFDTIFNDIHNTSDMIRQMMVKVSEVDEVATNVAAISEEQASSTEEISATSENITEQAKNIAASSKEVFIDAQELSEGAVQLSNHLKKFKID